MKKLFLIIAALMLTLFPSPTLAQSEEFTAKVIDVQDTFVRIEKESGDRVTIDSDIATLRTQAVQPGDMVIITAETQADGNELLFISDFVRAPWVMAALGLFVLAVIALQRKKGIRALLSLMITLGIVLFGMIPLILRGWNPVLVSIVLGTIAMAASIYIAHGYAKKSHITIITIGIILLFIGIASWLFIRLTALSGIISEEAVSLISLGYSFINLRGLLLAAIIIGSMGVLDDMVFSQLSVIEQLKAANKNMTKRELFTRAYTVGHDHTTAIINTLVLAYTGAAFPLLILLSIGQAPFDSFYGIMNHEMIATEVVRTVIGSIGLLLAMPIATLIGVELLSPAKQGQKEETTCC